MPRVELGCACNSNFATLCCLLSSYAAAGPPPADGELASLVAAGQQPRVLRVLRAYESFAEIDGCGEATGLAGWFCCCSRLSGSRLLATLPSCCHVPSPMLPLTPLPAHACVAGSRSGSLGVAKLVAFLGN